jgi:hypothetical protein
MSPKARLKAKSDRVDIPDRFSVSVGQRELLHQYHLLGFGNILSGQSVEIDTGGKA